MIVELPGLAATLVATLLAAGCTSTPPMRARHSHTRPNTAPVVINSDVGEILTPASGAHAGLTAKQAWINYTRTAGHPQSKIPGNLRVVLGRLALPPQFSDRLVWAYGYGPTGCVTTLPSAATPTGIEWTFLDANTGRMLEGTCQQTSA
jgi:hypothetical protein